jgi:hypothetical protein
MRTGIGDGMNSMVTLPSEDLESQGIEHNAEGAKNKGAWRQTGTDGVERHVEDDEVESFGPRCIVTVPAFPAASTTLLSTDFLHHSYHYLHGQIVAAHLRPQTSSASGLESVQSNKDKDTPANSLYRGGLPLNHKSSLSAILAGIYIPTGTEEQQEHHILIAR